ncbi:sigma-70 family RNA polymerase sigma factor [Acrocarpospora macrocephala]|uniref:DNA-directed RNA polymerase sigma-70 factor n=1 Tax=Acrocarpospora macrocephala TaxID=150177 RepID=A0A5M3X6K9_9ACTN|nr:DNA-directed RNA polymerase sigma-70 factor [Acrocarpospora macrocephala]
MEGREVGQFERKRRFEDIYRAHYPALLGYVRRRTDSADDAADVLAEAFMTAWRRLEDVPPDAEARLWLYGVARRVLANHHRDTGRRSALALKLRAELVSCAEAAVEQDPSAVRTAFGRLSSADRELLGLVGWEGLTASEIAKVLGRPPSVVRLRLHRARKRLAKELDSAELDLSAYGSRAVSLAKGES